MAEEIKTSNQPKAAPANRSAYEPPKLNKHGTIHDRTLTAPGGQFLDSGGTIPNIFADFDS